MQIMKAHGGKMLGSSHKAYLLEVPFRCRLAAWFADA